jgi:hypothetical protein
MLVAPCQPPHQTTIIRWNDNGNTHRLFVKKHRTFGREDPKYFKTESAILLCERLCFA